MNQNKEQDKNQPNQPPGAVKIQLAPGQMPPGILITP